MRGFQIAFVAFTLGVAVINFWLLWHLIADPMGVANDIGTFIGVIIAGAKDAA